MVTRVETVRQTIHHKMMTFLLDPSTNFDQAELIQQVVKHLDYAVPSGSITFELYTAALVQDTYEEGCWIFRIEGARFVIPFDWEYTEVIQKIVDLTNQYMEGRLAVVLVWSKEDDFAFLLKTSWFEDK